MNKKITLLFLTTIFFIGIAQSQIFVKHDASGSNDGTSWDNAYTDLADALNTANAGAQVWVAAGTYKPGSGAGDTSSFFRFLNDIELYGGFVGTENVVSERDWANNETILSGDHSGNDILNNFDDNRTDNSQHVMWLTDTITRATIIDGFTFSNGHTAPASSSGNARRGGGLFTLGAPTIKNCLFKENYGYFGGGLYPRLSGADGILIENCRFENNLAHAGGGIYANSPTIEVIDCSFSGNETNTLHGGGFYCSTRGNATIKGCTFSNNTANNDNRGGGIYLLHSPGTISDCTFIGNKSIGSSGGGLMVRDLSDEPPFVLNIMNCTFTNNSGNFGGAFGCYDGGSTANLTDCTFKDNTSTSLGGATTNGFGATSNFTNCIFESNNADQSGGAIFNQNNGSNITLMNCALNLNESQDRGGAIAFNGNTDVDTIPLASLTLINTTVEGNIAEQQGGGLNISNANLHIENSLIHNNFATNSESVGGGISFNASDTIHTVFRILNSTIADNISSIGSGIANWKGGVEGTSQLTVQNTIFGNSFGMDYEVEDGDPVVVSAGGNLSIGASMNDILVEMNDLTETDPLFVDVGMFDFRLADGSPCIDQGIATDAPMTDLAGNPRVGAVDMGCFENQKTSGTADLDKTFGDIQIFPNPVQEELNFRFESDWKGTMEVSVIDQVGRLLFVQKLEKGTRDFASTIHVAHLPQGIYNLSISNGEVFQVENFVK